VLFTEAGVSGQNGQFVQQTVLWGQKHDLENVQIQLLSMVAFTVKVQNRKQSNVIAVFRVLSMGNGQHGTNGAFALYNVE
jgi:hypothetical protein